MAQAAINLEDRPDYMLEAFLDEQHILLKPLYLRRLGLLATLDLRAQTLERQLKRPGMTAKEYENVLKELIDLADEKVAVAKQLQDVAGRQMDTLLEVEQALEIAAKREREEFETKQPVADGPVSTRSKTTRQREYSFHDEVDLGFDATGTAATVGTINPEIWCVCRKPDDGRPMVACDNDEKCAYLWWHVDCVERQVFSRGFGKMPEESGNWFCPHCVETGNVPKRR